MLSETDCITKLLGLQGILITELKEFSDRIEIYLETKAAKAACPRCKTETQYIHDYRTQRIKDLHVRGKPVILVLRKRRYVCPDCGKRFFEKYAFLPRYHRMTQRTYENILRSMRENRSMKSIAAEHTVSVNTVSRIFDIVNYYAYKLPSVLSIDEFKGNAGNEKYQCILTDPGRRKITDILPTREKTYLIDYFKQFKRDHVTHIIIDMWQPYYDTCRFLFPKATIIIDRYHYVRQLYWALDRVRKRVQKKFFTEKRLYFKRLRKLLYAPLESLSDDNKQALSFMLSQHDDLFTAWQLKELFRSFRKCESSEKGRLILKQWILTAQEAALPEFNDCITAYLNWFEPILNSLDYPYTNAFTEGINNKIKVLKRIAYGYRNFQRFRNRILHICA